MSDKSVQKNVLGENLEIENFEEGNFPRKLFIVYNKKI